MSRRRTTSVRGATVARATALACTALLLAACAPGATSGGADDGTPVAELPLRPGFYVASDTECAAASTATLLLVRRDGFAGARDACDFDGLARHGDGTRYRATQRCAEHPARPADAAPQRVEWEIPDEVSFALHDGGGPRRFRWCEQSTLPDPWRDNDISDVVAAAR